MRRFGGLLFAVAACASNATRGGAPNDAGVAPAAEASAMTADAAIDPPPASATAEIVVGIDRDALVDRCI